MSEANRPAESKDPYLRNKMRPAKVQFHEFEVPQSRAFTLWFRLRLSQVLNQALAPWV